MYNNLKEFILVTHRGCSDGSACALLFLAAGGKKENIRFTNPNHADVDELVFSLLTETLKEKVFLVDVSISQKTAEDINKTYYRDDITIIDHHKSAIPLKKFSWCIINENNDKCGSKLFYDWLLNNPNINHTNIRKYKELVKLVNDVDLWIHQYPDSNDISALHKILGQELFIERFVKNPSCYLTANEMYLIEIYSKKQDMDIKHKKEQVKKHIKTINGEDYSFGFVLADDMDQSVLGNSICEDFDLNIDVAVIIRGNNVSLRKKRDCQLDLSEVAKTFNGAGHSASSGCKLSGIIGKELVELVNEHMRF